MPRSLVRMDGSRAVIAPSSRAQQERPEGQEVVLVLEDDAPHDLETQPSAVDPNR